MSCLATCQHDTKHGWTEVPDRQEWSWTLYQLDGSRWSPRCPNMIYNVGSLNLYTGGSPVTSLTCQWFIHSSIYWLYCSSNIWSIYSSILLRMKTWSNFVAACSLRHIVAEEWIGCIQCCCAVPRFCALRSGPPPGNYPGKSPVEDASFQDVLHWKVDMFPIVSHEPCVVFAWTYVFFLEHVMSGSHCQLAAR